MMNIVTFIVEDGEDLRPGDVVSINKNGKIQKAVPGQTFLGALPPATAFRGNTVQVPPLWP